MKIKMDGEVVTIVSCWDGGVLDSSRWHAYHLMKKNVPVAQLTMPAGLKDFRAGFKFKTGGHDYEVIKD